MEEGMSDIVERLRTALIQIAAIQLVAPEQWGELNAGPLIARSALECRMREAGAMAC